MKKTEVNPFEVDHRGIRFNTDKRPIDPITKKEKIMMVRLFVKAKFTITKNVDSSNDSYRLKHLVERHLGFSVSNGELITAMIAEGFTAIPVGYGSPNCCFNVYVPKSLWK